MAEYEKTIAQMIGGCPARGLPWAPQLASLALPWPRTWGLLDPPEAPHPYSGPWGPWRHLDGHRGTCLIAHLLGKGFGLVPGMFELLLLGETRNPV